MLVISRADTLRSLRIDGQAPAPATRALAGIDDGAALDLLCRLIGTPSANPPGNEAGVARVLAEALAEVGIEASLDEVHPGRPNLTGSYGDNDGPVLLLNGHTDTMPPGEGWSTDPFRAVVRDGRVYGLGACDMKAGVAAAIEAVRAVARADFPLRGRVILDAVVDEEDGGSGTKTALARGRRADWAVIVEPTGLDVVRIGNGQVNFEVTFRGTAAHGSTPERGRNAVYDAAAFVALVEREAACLAAADAHPLIGTGSYSVGRVAGGVRTSIVPAECRVGVDRRILPGETPADAEAHVDRLIAEVVASRPGARAERRVECSYFPFDVPESLPVCRALVEAAAEASGREVALAGIRATTDAVFLCQAGIPSVIFGPGSVAQAHRPDESVSIDELRAATCALVLTIVRLLA